MRYLATFLIGGALLGFESIASADVLVYEPFDYTSGEPITGQVNAYSQATETWQLAGDPAKDAIHRVGSGSLIAPMGSFPPSLGNDGDLKKSGTTNTTATTAYDRLNIPNVFNPDLSPKYGANSTLYYSVLLNVPSIAGLTIAHSNPNANNDGLIAFSNVQGSQGTAPNTWNGELVIRLGADASKYNLGIRASTTPNNTTGSIPGATYWTGDLVPGQTYFIVAQATLGTNPGTAANDLNSIWLNPNSATFGLDETNRPAPDGSSIGGDSGTDANNSMQSIIIGAGVATAGAAPNDTFIDELRVGTTWADVTAVPEASAGLFVALAGVVMWRWRKK